MLEAVEHAQGRALGFAYLNPKHIDESLAEIDRCIRDGPLVGVKLWVALCCGETALEPIVLRAITQDNARRLLGPPARLPTQLKG